MINIFFPLLLYSDVNLIQLTPDITNRDYKWFGLQQNEVLHTYIHVNEMKYIAVWIAMVILL